LLLSSSPHPIANLLSFPQDQLPSHPISCNDALLRALALTSAQLQQALRAVQPPQPSASSSSSRLRERSSSSRSSCIAAGVRSHVIGPVPDRGGRPDDLTRQAVKRDVSTANTALKGQHQARGRALPLKRDFRGCGVTGGKR
jgi:hypothetical protein